MKYKNLIIISNVKKSHLGLGEYLRVASFLPNINFMKCIWYSCDRLMPILNEIDYLHYKKKYKQFNLRLKKNNDLLINLTNKKIDLPNTININDFSFKQREFKRHTGNLLKLFANKLGIKNYKIFTNKKIRNKNKLFINWKVPKEWKIKSYPKKNWKELIKKINQHKKIKIEWQKNNSDLKYLIKEIKESKIIISVVSLACHLAILFNKKLITLSGPNYFQDLNLYKNNKTIFTKKKCMVHKKILNVKYSKCDCMKFIDNNEILKRLIDEI